MLPLVLSHSNNFDRRHLTLRCVVSFVSLPCNGSNVEARYNLRNNLPVLPYNSNFRRRALLYYFYDVQKQSFVSFLRSGIFVVLCCFAKGNRIKKYHRGNRVMLGSLMKFTAVFGGRIQRLRSSNLLL